jgi:hypothetical protein
MANVFESDPATMIFGFVPGTLASDHGFSFPYKKWE